MNILIIRLIPILLASGVALTFILLLVRLQLQLQDILLASEEGSKVFGRALEDVRASLMWSHAKRLQFLVTPCVLDCR